ncbi:excinuclease ATPase subunit [Marinobacter changyiensis]|uniref:excinuclease ATPase subunit n=1 Tax=Marinobacter changyiensis TaxID=2604091 RepID=UPI0012644865|nr:excinuclease ATPase subunit [Marinobacter changyiensis]
MKKLLIFSALVATIIAFPAHSRDTVHMLPLEDALKMPDAQAKLDGSVEFYFAGQDHPPIERSLVETFTNKKTNAFGKSDEDACNWVFLSAMIALQDRAKREGADAVVDIVSYYDKREIASATEFECHAGAIMAGVALKGNFVMLQD